MAEQRKMFVKPAPGRRLKDPYTFKLVDSAGEWKPVESYWLRAVLFHDAIECTPEATTTTTKEPVKLSDETTPRPTKHSKKHEPTSGRGENQ